MEAEQIIPTPSDGLSGSVQKMRVQHGRTTGPTRRSTKGQWTPEEDEILQRAVQRFKGKNWKKIAECFKDRTDVQCLHRWQKVLNPELVKGPWSKEEDETIVELVNKLGPKKWSTIAQSLPGRIGKQCRERWHNHLNPAINKQAWTQEEELALVRAHQIYGNRWAELSKFLSGRTDNAIKNHWNSSVKKKLDSYLASGLLEQLPALPHAGQPYLPVLPSSRVQSSGDDSCLKTTETEDISECSQNSFVVAAFQSTMDMTNADLHSRYEFQQNRDSGVTKEQSSTPASCSEQQYTSLEDVSLSIPEVPGEGGRGRSVQALDQRFFLDCRISSSGDFQRNLHELYNISSLELEQESSQFLTHCVGSKGSHEVVNVSYQTSIELTVASPMGNIAMGSDNTEHMLISDDECCRILFSDAMNERCFSPGNTKLPDTINLNGLAESISCQSSCIQTSETGKTMALQSYDSKSNVLGNSCSQSQSQPFLSAPSVVSANDGTFLLASKANRNEMISIANEGFNYTANSPCVDGGDNIGTQELLELKDLSKLVPVNTFGSVSDIAENIPFMNNGPNTYTEQHDAGALCYEPPRFPSLDVPFFSCDLVQSSDMQQEYSPLGIRQLTISSLNCDSPYRYPPSRDDSPDAVLKSAAKTFLGTPSIMKKRHRESWTPLSDRRNDKKLEINKTSSLAESFSRLDVMFDDVILKKSPPSPSSNQKRNFRGSTEEDKENIRHAFELRQGRQRGSSNLSDDRIFHKDLDSISSRGNKKEEDVDTKTKGVESAVQSVEQPSGVLIEHDMNDLHVHSSDNVGVTADSGMGAGTPEKKNLISLEATIKQDVPSNLTSGNPRAPVSSPTDSGNNHENHSVASATVQSVSFPAPLEIMGENTAHCSSSATFNISVESPSAWKSPWFKRSIESPSAWKSPWFNSFLPGPRVDTDITIEDIGVFMSPGDRSYDAIGLMKQISEHTAVACANAQVVLGNETPDTLLKSRRRKNQSLNKESNHGSHNQLGNRSHLAPSVLEDARTLDFSEYATPAKETDNGKSSTSLIASSPSSYLLKSCR